MYFTLVSSLDFCLISSLFFNFYCMTAHITPPKVRYPVKTINGVSSPSSSLTPPVQQQQQSLPGQQLSDIQNVQSDWIKIIGPNNYPLRGNRLASNYIPNQFSVNSQLPSFPPSPPPPPPPPPRPSPQLILPPSSSLAGLPGSYFLSSSSHQSSPIYSSIDYKDNLNPSDLKPQPQASSSSLSSSSWPKLYPSSHSGSVIWPNQVKSSA